MINTFSTCLMFHTSERSSSYMLISSCEQALYRELIDDVIYYDTCRMFLVDELSHRPLIISLMGLKIRTLSCTQGLFKVV